MPGIHASIAPSSLAMRVACHAFAQMAEPYKDDPPTPESLEGDAAHWVNAQLMITGVLPALGLMTPQGIPVDEDMQDGALIWQGALGDCGQSEFPVVIERLDPTDCWGTPDWWRYDPLAGVLRVADYKYGHLYVDVYENWQLLAYTMGLMDTLGLDEKTTRIELTVVQPRNYRPEGPVRRWDFDAILLRNFTNRARFAIEKSRQANPEATVGTHCDFCPARHECHTLQKATMAAVTYSSSMDRVNMPPAAVAAELNILEAAAALIDARRTGLQAQAMALVKGGKLVPGWAIDHPLGRLAWTKTPPEIFMLGDLLGIDLRKEPAPITPTQAAKKGIDQAVISTYAARPPGAAKLVQQDNTMARKIFGANAQ